MDKIDYLFIDGGCLRETVKEVGKKFFHGNEVEIDYEKLSYGFYKTFYYDAKSPQLRDETDESYKERIKPQIDFFNNLRSIRGFHVYEGITRHRGDRNEQKQVDVMIAVDMLTHTIRGNMNRATLLSSDLDYKPLINALVQEGMFVTLWYQSKHTNRELIYSADYAVPLTVHRLYELATDKFKEKFRIPRTYVNSSRNDVTHLLHVDKWSIKSGLEVNLYKKQDLFVLEFPDQANAGYYTYAEYDDLELLIYFVEDKYYMFDWERVN